MPRKRRRPTDEQIERRIVPVAGAEPHVKMLVYGRNGAGKTRFAATAPDVLIIDIHERGTRSARRSDAHVIRVTEWEDVTYLYWYLRKGEHKFRSVALDTLTAMQNLCVARVLKEDKVRDPYKDPKVVSLREWGKVAEMMKPLLLAYRNLPMHVIFVTQEKMAGEQEQEETGMHVPDLTPGSRGTAMGSVDVLGRMYQREVRVKDPRNPKKRRSRWEPRMLVGPHEDYRTKDRTGQLGRVMRNPTVPAIIDAASQ